VNNPAGRLPVTFYKSVDQLPPFDEYAMKGRTYRYFEGSRCIRWLWLSYSKFVYSGLHLSADELHAGIRYGWRCRCITRATGKRMKWRNLFEFPEIAGGSLAGVAWITRVHLAAGETRKVELLWIRGI